MMCTHGPSMHHVGRACGCRGGFTLVEMMVASMIMVMVLTSVVSFFVSLQRGWFTATLVAKTAGSASFAMERITYGSDGEGGLRSIDADDVLLVTNEEAWRLYFDTGDRPRYFEYDPIGERLVDQNMGVLCRNVTSATAMDDGNGCAIAITVQEGGGQKNISNTMRTYVEYRN